MEHILQFGIDIDDEFIKKNIYTVAEDRCVREVVNQFERTVFDYSCWGDKQGVTQWARQRFDEFLEGHKDAIIEKAALVLADKLSRSKTVREAAAIVAHRIEEQVE